MKQLEHMVSRINKATGSPEASYTKHGDKYTANIGNYHLDGAYGGWQLQRMCTDGGGVDQPIGGGYVPKRELYDKMRAYLAGIEQHKA